MNLKIEDETIKEEYFKMLKNILNIPICLNCKLFFGLGFPKTDKAILDYIICVSNNLVCTCENLKKLEKDIMNSDNKSHLKIEKYYK